MIVLELGFLDNFEGVNELISLIIRYCDYKEDSSIQVSQFLLTI